MNKTQAVKTFPCYKNNKGKIIFSEENLPPCAAEIERKNVYRLCLNGKINKEAFDCTYINKKKKKLTIRDDSLSDAGTFSTSCCYELKEIIKKQAMFTKNNPKAIIAIGDIEKESGYSCTDREWKTKKNSHIHWWIYLESKPYQHNFKEYKHEE